MVGNIRAQANVFWERLSLMSSGHLHLQNNESRYMPVQRKPETLSWITDIFKTKQI